MKSEFFSMFGIPPTECEIESCKDELGVPRLWFRSTGNPLVGLDLTGATQLQHLLTDAGEANQANEICAVLPPIVAQRRAAPGLADTRRAMSAVGGEADI